MVNLVETVLIIRIIDTFKVATFVIAVNPNEEADMVHQVLHLSMSLLLMSFNSLTVDSSWN